MDQELKAFLEERFARVQQETTEQFARAKQETTEQFARAKQETAKQFAEVHAQLEAMGEKVNLTQITVEGLRGDIRMVAEGVMGVTERLETFQAETTRDFQEAKDTRVPVFRDLGSRITAHDNHLEDLNSRIRHVDDRVRTLETRAERQTKDVFEAIQQKFGKSQDS
jgi:predicted  nucleic acid-binding Zn-ribbon protein